MTTQGVELSLVLPAYNEAGNIARVVERAAAHLGRCRIDYEMLVVDDGSSDGTSSALSDATAAGDRLRVIRHPVNLGYGAAIRSGLAAARGEHILVSDGDGQFRIEDLQALWPHRHEVDLVLGYRNPRNDPWIRRLAGWAYNRVLVRVVLGTRFRDVNCGFKLIARRILQGMELSSTGALISAELLTRARLRGATFVEVGVGHFPRASGRATGLLPRVVLRMVRELIGLRSRILATPSAASASGREGELRTDYDRIKSAAA